MGLKPLEVILILAVVGTPAALAWFIIRTIRKVRRVIRDENQQ